ncbi:hypothetical protein [Falsiroseomonas frigidaquae]|nr:hypothetical protein [Falsiroseomonas frigidaquae]
MNRPARPADVRRPGLRPHHGVDLVAEPSQRGTPMIDAALP